LNKFLNRNAVISVGFEWQLPAAVARRQTPAALRCAARAVTAGESNDAVQSILSRFCIRISQKCRFDEDRVYQD
jgi:hypothetical protein